MLLIMLPFLLDCLQSQYDLILHLFQGLPPSLNRPLLLSLPIFLPPSLQVLASRWYWWKSSGKGTPVFPSCWLPQRTNCSRPACIQFQQSKVQREMLINCMANLKVLLLVALTVLISRSMTYGATSGRLPNIRWPRHDHWCQSEKSPWCRHKTVWRCRIFSFLCPNISMFSC